jgi:hypothetical protein
MKVGMTISSPVPWNRRRQKPLGEFALEKAKITLCKGPLSLKVVIVSFRFGIEPATSRLAS